MMKERLVQKFFKKATSAALVASMVVTMVQPTIAMAAELDEEVVVETEVAADIDITEEADIIEINENEFDPYAGSILDDTQDVEVVFLPENVESSQYYSIKNQDISMYVVLLQNQGDRIYWKNETGYTITCKKQYTNGTNTTRANLKNGSSMYTYNNSGGPVYVFLAYSVATKTCKETCVLVKDWKFKDVWPNEKDWKYDAIKYMVDNNIMQGVDPNNFKPDETITRESMAQMIYNMEGSPSVSAKQVFKDVPTGRWSAKAITWCSQKGIIKGYTDGTFKPTTPVTREMIAQMIKGYAAYRGQNVSAGNNLGGFADANQVTWSRDAMNWAVQKGIISGVYENGQKKLLPQKAASRAETAAMVKKFKTAK